MIEWKDANPAKVPATKTPVKKKNDKQLILLDKLYYNALTVASSR